MNVEILVVLATPLAGGLLLALVGHRRWQHTSTSRFAP